ncbi:MAG: PEP-CTERM sorting domain-containing protein [Proteobacteria bacterium]|nr:PEP-CTERM sorting domain-containing protein [Pseudomonadota bacterium]
MNLHQTLLRTALGIALLLGASQASASVMLSLLPSQQNAGPGQTVNLDLTISGLGNHDKPSLGAFDFDFNFDSSKLTFTGYALSGFLGNIGLGEAMDESLGASGNSINLAELSLLTVPGDLATLQPSEFSFATLSFRVDSLSQYEQTWVSFGRINVLSDENGDSLGIPATSGAVIGNPVPEPPALLLFGLGLTLLIRNRRRV